MRVIGQDPADDRFICPALDIQKHRFPGFDPLFNLCPVGSMEGAFGRRSLVHPAVRTNGQEISRSFVEPRTIRPARPANGLGQDQGVMQATGDLVDDWWS